MADVVGSRMERQDAYVADPGRDVLSADQRKYTDPIAGMNAKFAADPVYSGRDPERRYQEGL